MEVTKSKEPTQGAKEEQKPELDSAIIDEPNRAYAISGTLLAFTSGRLVSLKGLTYSSEPNPGLTKA